jgi:hypothetical protein
MKKWIVILTALAIIGGCKKPQPSPAALAPAVACPQGYKAVSDHEGRGGTTRGLGFVIVPYAKNGQQRHLFCTQDDGVPDPRISTSTSGAIPPK